MPKRLPKFGRCPAQSTHTGTSASTSLSPGKATDRIARPLATANDPQLPTLNELGQLVVRLVRIDMQQFHDIRLQGFLQPLIGQFQQITALDW